MPNMEGWKRSVEAEIEKIRTEAVVTRSVEPKYALTVGDLRKAIEGLPDTAQMFINIDGYGEDFAIKAADPSEQIPVGVTEWPTDKRTVGLEIHVGKFEDGEVW